MIELKSVTFELWEGTYELVIYVDAPTLLEIGRGAELDWKTLTRLGQMALENPKVDRVLFHEPATVLFWNDGEKTVVKCRECNDGQCVYARDGLPEDAAERRLFCAVRFDREKAVMAGMLKRLYRNYQDVLRGALEGDADE